jgi:hypothetical protein
MPERELLENICPSASSVGVLSPVRAVMFKGCVLLKELFYMLLLKFLYELELARDFMLGT